MGQLSFVKMHGAGNDYVYANGADVPEAIRGQLATRLSDRHMSIGGDGFILVSESTVADCRMEMYNADGSRAEMCGNGIRCVAKYAFERARCSSVSKFTYAAVAVSTSNSGPACAPPGISNMTVSATSCAFAAVIDKLISMASVKIRRIVMLSSFFLLVRHKHDKRADRFGIFVR